MRSRRRVAATLTALTLASPAAAQSGLAGGIEVTTDERRRGLSWSGGDVALAADIDGALLGLEAGARVVTTRRARRHDGSDAVVDLTLGKGWDAGPVRLRARAIGHLFAGAGRAMDFGEVGGDASYTLGPARIAAGAIWAPEQSAIGGSNLYIFTSTSVGVPGTPLTVSAAVGRTSGTSDGSLRAARLRPGGDYTDWQLGIEHVRGPLTLAIDYVGTDVTRGRVGSPLADAGNSGDRLLARARWSF